MEKENLNNIDRRGFIKMSSLLGGGILFGINYLNAINTQASVPNDISKLNFVDFNAYIKIAENGKVTIFSANPEIGQGVKTSMPMIIAEELDVDWNDVVVAQADLNTKSFKRQMAGGSQSIKKGWKPLRKTGAIARQMLVNAAALKWKVSPDSLVTKSGYIINTNGKKISYGELVNEAAKLEVPTNVKLKNLNDFKIIGQGKRNVDVEKITKGEPLFGLDYKEEGMLYAAIVRPPAFGQKLIDFDASESKKIKGVTQVFQYDNNIAILGESTWSAFSGKKALKANWSSTEGIEGTKELDEKMYAILKGSKFKNLRKKGDVALAFSEADTIIEEVYESPFLPHNCMEPINFFANVTSKKITLAGSIQTPENSVKSVAKKLGRDLSEIELKMTRIGGGFGRRLTGDFVVEAAVISNIAKKPIKLVYTREDDMTGGIYKPNVKYKFKAAVEGDKITAYELTEAAVNWNMYRFNAMNFPFGAVPNYNAQVAKIESPITVGWWRAPISNFLAFAEQSFLDELAEKLKVDPIDYRIQMLSNVKGRVNYDSKRMIKVIEKVREESNWGKSKKDIYQGFSAYYSHSTYVAEVVEIRVVDDLPKIEKVFCAVDCGIVVNPLGAENQVVGGVIDGVGHAMFGSLEFQNGIAQSSNYDSYRLIRMNETPEVKTFFIKSDEAPTGLGEPTLPPVSGAIANAIKKAMGVRLRKLPFIKNGELNS